MYLNCPEPEVQNAEMFVFAKYLREQGKKPATVSLNVSLIRGSLPFLFGGLPIVKLPAAVQQYHDSLSGSSSRENFRTAWRAFTAYMQVQYVFTLPSIVPRVSYRTPQDVLKLVYTLQHSGCIPDRMLVSTRWHHVRIAYGKWVLARADTPFGKLAQRYYEFRPEGQAALASLLAWVHGQPIIPGLEPEAIVGIAQGPLLPLTRESVIPIGYGVLSCLRECQGDVSVIYDDEGGPCTLGKKGRPREDIPVRKLARHYYEGVGETTPTARVFDKPFQPNPPASMFATPTYATEMFGAPRPAPAPVVPAYTAPAPTYAAPVPAPVPTPLPPVRETPKEYRPIFEVPTSYAEYVPPAPFNPHKKFGDPG